MIAVTGANGLLGSFIVRKLIEQKKTFVALRRKDSDVSLLHDVAEHITWRTADVLNPVELEEALQGVTQVIHAAAMVSFNPLHKKKNIQCKCHRNQERSEHLSRQQYPAIAAH